MASPIETYGRLLEGTHISSYCFERLCSNLKWLLEADRWKECGEFLDVNAFMDSLQLAQFKQTTEDRRDIAKLIKELQPEVSNRQIARTLGVCPQTINRDLGSNEPLGIQDARGTADFSNGSGSNEPQLNDAGKTSPKGITPELLNCSGDDEYYTPKEWVDMARSVMGSIDCDPATTEAAQKTVGATTGFDKTSDGLKQKWSGNVWLNPPYSKGLIDKFINKLISENVTQAVVLTHNSTDTAWFHELVKFSDHIAFVKGRISFYNNGEQKTSPSGGSVFFYKGQNRKKFCKEFGDKCVVLTKEAVT